MIDTDPGLVINEAHSGRMSPHTVKQRETTLREQRSVTLSMLFSFHISNSSSKPLFNQGNPFRILNLKSISVINRSAKCFKCDKKQPWLITRH